MNRVRLSRRAMLAGLSLAAFPLRAARAAYPDQPIKWIIGYAPGGGTDILARLIAGSMSPRLGQPIVIDNRPGAATNIAAGAAAKSPPDGLTLFTASNDNLVFNPAMFSKLPFNPDEDFRFVGLIARFNLLLTVGRGSPITTAREFVEQAKAAAGKMTYGSPGIGSPHFLAMELLKREAGINLAHVPYRGMAPVFPDLMSGVVNSAIVDYAAGGPMMRSGELRPLAVCSAARLEGLPNVPTVQEALGLPNFEAYAWQGIAVPAKTPDAIVARLETELSAALAEEAVKSRMREIGIEPLPGGPDKFKALVQSDRKVWVPLIQQLGIKLD